MNLIEIDKLKSNLNNCKKLSDKDEKVRKLINISSKKIISIEDLNFIESLNSNIFLEVYKELFKEDISNMTIVNDMVMTEFAIENLESSIPFEDEEEIY